MDSEAALQAAAAEAMDTAPHRRPREEDEREAAAAAPPAKEARTDGGPDDADEAGAGVGAAAAAARAAPEDAEGRSALPTNIADCEGARTRARRGPPAARPLMGVANV